MALPIQVRPKHLHIQDYLTQYKGFPYIYTHMITVFHTQEFPYIYTQDYLIPYTEFPHIILERQ